MRNKFLIQNESISRRTFLLAGGKLGLLSLLAGRMLYLQMLKREEYQTLSENNRISLIVVPPKRGKIFDCDGKVIADNKACFRLLLDKSDQQDYQEEIKLIGKLLHLDDNHVENLLKKAKKASKRIPSTLIDQLDWEQITVIEENKPELASLFVDAGQLRHYPFAAITSHLIGYTGLVTEQEKKELEKTNIVDFNIGKSGIEKYYESHLRGEFGLKKMEVNAYGRYVRQISATDSISGSDLQLNIDASLQEKIFPLLSQNGSSAIVMDVTDGKVLLLASSPGFESNNFAKGLSTEYWNSLVNDPYKPLINKTVQNTYPPGSSFKIITILAALEAGINPDKIVHCNGGSALGTNSFRCWYKPGHGPMDMFAALKHSCNSYMYEIAKIIGAKKIVETAKKFGFGSLTGVDLPNEAAGFVPTSSWKKAKLGSGLNLGDALNLSIGQGFLLATPIQLVRMTAAIANDGKLLTPKIAKTSEVEFKQIDIKKQHLDIIKMAMYDAVNTPGGTAYYSRLTDPRWLLAGKTGTSQVQAKKHANDDLSLSSVAWERRNHAVFVGFAPYNNPRYSVLVFVDHGGGGGRVAAPIASKIMQEVLNKYS